MRRRTTKRSVKITDVAKLAGVAAMTVSRVLNAPDRVTPETTARVREAIEELGYVPNLIAGGLSSRRTRMIAAIVPTIVSPMFADTIHGFSDVFGSAGYQVLLAISGYDPAQEAAQLRAILSHQPDALMLTGTERAPDMRRLLRDAGIPMVDIWDITDTPADMVVGFDHHAIGAAMASHLLGKGIEHFAIVGAGDSRAIVRAGGFRDAILAAGKTMVAETVLPAPARITESRAATKALLAGMPPRLGVFCSSDFVGYGVVMEALAHGIAVPGRLAAIGFGDFEIGRECIVPITTINVNGTIVGRTAASLLLDRLNNRACPAAVTVPFSLVQRASS
jgi:LacI family gluconate utilization system Gnt-I transcriptional repressor